MPNLKERVGQWPHRISVVVLLFFLFYVAEIAHRDKGSDENLLETVITLTQGKEVQQRKLQAVLRDIIDTADKDNLQTALDKLSVLDPKMTHQLLERVIESRKTNPEAFSKTDILDVFIAFASHPDVEDYLSANRWSADREFWFSMSATIFSETGIMNINLSDNISTSWVGYGQSTSLAMVDTTPEEIEEFYNEEGNRPDGGEIKINHNQLKIIAADSPQGEQIADYLQQLGIDPDLGSDFSVTYTQRTIVEANSSGVVNSTEEVFSVLNTVNPRYRIRVTRRVRPGSSAEEITYFIDMGNAGPSELNSPYADESDFQTLENVWNAVE